MSAKAIPEQTSKELLYKYICTTSAIQNRLNQTEEFYVCIYATREGDYVLFHHKGGMDVGDVDAKAQKLLMGVDEKLNTEDIKRHLLVHAPEDKKEVLASFIFGLFNFYEDLHFTYLEINPFVVAKGGVFILEL
ncbi:hypothetical protein ACRRTK_019285 [Alexandromys fortis]